MVNVENISHYMRLRLFYDVGMSIPMEMQEGEVL